MGAWFDLDVYPHGPNLTDYAESGRRLRKQKMNVPFLYQGEDRQALSVCTLLDTEGGRKPHSEERPPLPGREAT